MAPRLTMPTMHELMTDPIYRAYMKRQPAQTHANATGKPWQLWVSTPDRRWLTAQYETYADAWPRFVARLRAGDDPTITSRRVFYAPPGEWYKVRVRCNPTQKHPDGKRIEDRWRQMFQMPPGLSWCGRCRRPVYWMPLFADHHALRKMPAVTDDENIRCIICGIRKYATPPVEQMVRL